MNEANYTKLQNQYFQAEVEPGNSDSSESRDSGIGEMVSGDDQSLASSDVPTPGDSDRSFVISPVTSNFSHSKKKMLYSEPRTPSSTKSPPISRNKLINQAVEDSRAYLVLSSEEVHRVKSELVTLNNRFESLKNRLMLETKVRDAAQSLRRLHASNKKLSQQADEQLDQANRKLDQINQESWDVANRIWTSQRQLFQHTSAVLAIAATQPQPSFTNDGEMPATLQDALAVIDVKDQKIKMYQTQPAPVCRCHKLDELKAQLVKEKAKVHQLEEELNSFRSESISPDVSDLKLQLQQATEEADLLFKRNMETNHLLAQLYNELPDLDCASSSTASSSSHNSLDFIYGTDPRFTLEQFSAKVDNLIQENHDLIDKILSLQEQQQTQPQSQYEPTPSDASPRFTLPEVEYLVNDLQSLLDTTEAHAENLQSQLDQLQATHQLKSNQLQLQINQLNEELETKDILCSKYQQILNTM